MASRSKAFVIVCLFAVLTLFIKPLGIIAGGIIALATFAINLNAALMLSFASSAAVGFASFWLIESTFIHTAIYLSMFVIPVIVASVLVRSGLSLDKASLSIAGWIIALTVLAQFLLGGSLSDFWQVRLEALISQLQVPLSVEQIGTLSLTLTPILGAMAFLSALLSFFLGYHWKSVLSEEESFSTLFRNISFGSNAAIVMTIILGLAFINNNLAFNISGIIGAVCLVQGIAILHFIMHVRKWNRIWLFIFYFLVLLIPEAMLLLASLGLVDNWINFRKKITPAITPK